MKDWYDFQEEIRNYFIEIGCKAQTNIKLSGIRTSHDIDIYVESNFLGHDIKWIIEAKQWKSKVTKVHVLALRQIVDDIGADKGIIVSQMGFQKGAFEAIKNTNIQLYTFEELQKFTSKTIQHEILKNYLDRVNIVLCRYFSHSKKNRIEYELKSGIENIGYFNVYSVLTLVIQAINDGLKNQYPIYGKALVKEQYGDGDIENFNQLINWLNKNLLIIDEKILKAEIAMQKNNDFNPELYYETTEENSQIKFLNNLQKLQL